ncbi:hypothetical protein AAIH35_32180, partial [Pseudomonas aeruginosa]
TPRSSTTTSTPQPMPDPPPDEEPIKLSHRERRSARIRAC